MADKLIRTIKAVSVKNKANGSIGFLTQEQENVWYNVQGEEKVLDEMLKIIRKGNVVEFEMDNGIPGNFVLKEAAKESGFNSDDLTSFEELLNDAHDKFDDFSIKTEMIENDWENQRAIFKATVEILRDTGDTKIGKCPECGCEFNEPIYQGVKSFQAYGDATQENCGEMVKKHYIRMAETRAIARALRWATNNAKAAAEETENGELPDQDSEPEEGSEEDMSKP